VWIGFIWLRIVSGVIGRIILEWILGIRWEGVDWIHLTENKNK
jgi:hypothetical protein